MSINWLYNVLILGLLSVVLVIVFIWILQKYIHHLKWAYRKQLKGKQDVCHVGIFHPYANAGGGGERVLWCAIRALQDRYQNKIKIILYTGDVDQRGEKIVQKARNDFNIRIDSKNLEFVFLNKRGWVEAEKYPHFTLLGQSIGSMVLGMEALIKYQPDVYIDTMGYAFTLPLFRYLGGCKVGCYVHYPTISIDMLRRVKARVYAHNNANYVTRNPFLTWIKTLYYQLFAKLYSLMGRSAVTVMVNSSWTENHILSLWNIPFKTHRVYPPCEINHLKKLQHIPDPERIAILSVGQFRPEKDHPLQLQAMYELRSMLIQDEALWNKLKLVIVGSCRNKDDYERLKNMQDLSKHLSLENSVEFQVNISYQELLQQFERASIGLHTMWNEHFGIGVVECLAAGLITVANRSGGPLMDIIETSEGSRTGYLAIDAHDYANCIAKILFSAQEENDKIRDAARSSAERFSETEFERNFLHATSLLFVDLSSKTYETAKE